MDAAAAGTEGLAAAIGELTGGGAHVSIDALGDVGRALAAMDGPAGAGMTVVRLAG
jgi:hypothetical protein